MARARSQTAAPADVFPALTISTDTWQPAAPGVGPVRQQWRDHNGALVATGGADHGGWWMRWPHLATYTFGPDGDVVAFPAHGSHTDDITDSYVRGVLPIVLLAREHEALHASGVLQNGCVAAFCAASGTGKSSLAFAVAAGVAGHWADDTVILKPTARGPEALSLPFPTRVDEAVRARVGTVDRGAEAVLPGTCAPLRRVYVLVRDPALDPRHPVFTTVPPTRRFERLLPHAHPFDLSSADRRRRMITRLIQAAAATSVYELRFGPSLQSLPALAARVRDHIARPDPLER